MRLKRLLPVETTNLLSPRSKADKYSEQNDFLWIAAQFHKVQGQAKLAAACAYSPNYDVDGYWETDSRTRRHHLDAKRWIWGQVSKLRRGKPSQNRKEAYLRKSKLKRRLLTVATQQLLRGLLRSRLKMRELWELLAFFETWWRLLSW